MSAFSHSERELNDRLLRGMTYRDEPVGAGVVKVKGQLNGSLEVEGGVRHAPDLASEAVTCADTMNYLRGSVYP